MASRTTRSQSRSSRASGGVSQEPPTQPTLARARYDEALEAVIPPVGQNRACGTGEPTDFRKSTPPAASAGKNFISV